MKALFNLWILLLHSCWLMAQPNYRFEHITVNDGLAHSDAVGVAHDTKGFIWVATNNGIDRYDGYQLKNYLLPNANTNGLYTNRISAIEMNPNGTLWAAPEEQGIYYYNASLDQFVNLSLNTSNTQWKKLLSTFSCRSITFLTPSTLMVGSRTGQILQISLSPSLQVTHLKQWNFSSSTSIHQLKTDQHKNVWIGTSNLGLWKLSSDKKLAKVNLWPELQVNTLFISPENEVWVGSSNKVGRIQNKNFIELLHETFASINCIYQDKLKRIWIGTNYGLHLLTLKNTDLKNYTKTIFSANFPSPNSINSNRIHQVIEDDFHNLWIAASAGGLNKISFLAKPFYHLKKDPYSTTTLADNYINTLKKDTEDNVLWIGTRNGFSRYDLQQNRYTNFLHNPNPNNLTNVSVSNFWDSGQGYIWVLTRWSGVYILNKKTLQLQKLPDIPQKTPWTQMEPLSIEKDEEGNLWIATFYDGIHVFNTQGQYLDSYSTQNSELPTNNLTFLMFDPEEKVMWASTRNAGVLKLQVQNQKIHLKNHFAFDPKTQSGLKFNFTWPLLIDKHKNIWVGTLGGGLHLIQNKNGKETITRYDQWLPEPNVESIIEGDNDEIWIGGRGLYRFNTRTKTYLHYDVADGLQSNSFKVGAATSSQEGVLYFGGINGISYFNPSAIQANPHAPKMQITRVRLVSNPNQLLSTSNVTIKSNENDFTIEFVGLHFLNPKKQHYQYQLEGYHKDWINLPQGQRVAAFAGLPPGSYTFKVRADNGDNVWSSQPAEVAITILAPWYKTLWAYAAYLFIIALLFYWYIVENNKTRDLKHKIEKEQLEKAKQKELADLKLNFFTQVSHELRTPLTLILNPAEDLLKASETQIQLKTKAELVYKQAQKLLGLVNQLMDFRKIETGNVQLNLKSENIISFIQEIFLIFKIKAEEQNIHYSIQLPEEDLWMNFDPYKVEVILTNLLANAFKYTPSGGNIHLLVKIEDQLFIQVCDNGKGIPASDLPYIFEPFYQSVRQTHVHGTGIGLSLVREFVNLHQGNISVNSQEGQGTCFSLKLPIQKNQIQDNAAEQEPEMHFEAVQATEKITNEKILIIEDNADLRKYVNDLLGAEFEVFEAENGAIGYQKILEIQPDLIISDVMMPEMDGLELTQKIKVHPKLAHIPLILITARGAALHELEGLESGADDYIVKPFNPKILRTKVQGLLHNRKRIRTYFQTQLLTQPSEAILPDTDKLFLEQTMRLIENNLVNSQFSVQTLVKESGMSQSAFYRKIKNLTGHSAVEIIRDVRLKRAAQLLSTGQYRVMEVMHMVGMEDYKYFRSAFQKSYQMSPSEYAKSQQKA